MLHSLSFRQLRAFRAIMLLGSTVKAATELGVSQPAISRLLREMEHLAGCELFDRRQGRLIPTEEAEVLFQETHVFMANYDRVCRFLSELKSRESGQLRVVGTNAIAHGLLPQAIGEFSKRSPKVAISLGITVRDEIRKWVNEQEFDIAVAAMPIEYPIDDIEKLGVVRGVCILPSSHALAERQVIEAEDLKGERFVSLSSGTVGRLYIDMMFERLGIELQKLVEAQTSEAVCELVSHNQGVSLVDPFTAARFINRKVVVRPFLPVVPFEYACLYPVRRARARFSSDLVACIQRCFAEFSKAQGL
ncbi:LysR family transcriptional regulator [Allopusillimonas ginsengisoli]|uniref:LysR family transcriptional regulator n=1 Tax=Allopusillimonas ginsengisoli TaxID=453575 RepID=UPI00102069A8|nr:LysR family transcriptional regulator [Allopusillimonas ginsengisoli]TEA79966.1 LysR family transcriptional regulator [Allopusillimonas ginsengisoli]